MGRGKWGSQDRGMGLRDIDYYLQDFPGRTVVKNLPASARDRNFIPGLGRFQIPQGSLS